MAELSDTYFEIEAYSEKRIEEFLQKDKLDESARDKLKRCLNSEFKQG